MLTLLTRPTLSPLKQANRLLSDYQTGPSSTALTWAAWRWQHEGNTSPETTTCPIRWVRPHTFLTFHQADILKPAKGKKRKRCLKEMLRMNQWCDSALLLGVDWFPLFSPHRGSRWGLSSRESIRLSLDHWWFSAGLCSFDCRWKGRRLGFGAANENFQKNKTSPKVWTPS